MSVLRSREFPEGVSSQFQFQLRLHVVIPSHRRFRYYGSVGIQCSERAESRIIRTGEIFYWLGDAAVAAIIVLMLLSNSSHTKPGTPCDECINSKASQFHSVQWAYIIVIADFKVISIPSYPSGLLFVPSYATIVMFMLGSEPSNGHIRGT